MSHCKICHNEPVLYKNPEGEKRRLVLACCSNWMCVSRQLPPVAGVDSFQALAAFNLKFGKL